jgi:hypothetical protein
MSKPKQKTPPKTYNNEYLGNKYVFRSKTSDAHAMRHDGGGKDRYCFVDRYANRFTYIHASNLIIPVI